MNSRYQDILLGAAGEILLLVDPASLTILAASPATARLLFAHSDWSGYSVFEEAFTRGHAAGWAAA